MNARSLAPLLALPLLLAAGDSEDASAEKVSGLLSVVQRDGDNAEAHAQLAEALLELGRNDQAAHHLERAWELYEASGDDKVARLLKSRLYRTDPLCSSRHKMFERISDRLVDSARKLAENGSVERALALVDGVLPIARGKELAAAETLRAELAAAFERVDLGAAGSEKDASGAWPLHEASSARYELSCNLEPEVVELIGETMDSIFDYYVSLYFDGDDSKIRNERATIRIYPTKDEMLGNWQGGSAPEGWWSPSTREVVSFDTRSTWGSLDPLLETLFHEASHQFMTFMTRGGGAPSWLNEGTSSFFEGAVAMADNRVLWPDAALGRLSGLRFQLEKGVGPTPRQVVEYQQPGSYPGEYYSFGWGLVYYLQQYEDPETLEYVYRPLYGAYRDEITSKQCDSMELFEEVFLGRGSPRGHKTFEDFEADWKEWILDVISPLHLAQPKERRALRMAEIERYLAAADAAAGRRKAPVSEHDLLRRALGHIEYVRTRIDDEDAPDTDLLLKQAGILERLDYKESAAPLLEQWLDIADGGELEYAQELYDDVEERLKKIDSKNHTLRRLRSSIRQLVVNARRLTAKYEDSKEPMPLRAYTFASSIAHVFADDAELAREAERLKTAAREAGVLAGVVRSVSEHEGSWVGIYQRKPNEFRVSGSEITIKSLADNGRVLPGLECEGEYELRCELERQGKLHRGALHGLVVAGSADDDWQVVGLTSEGKLVVKQIVVAGGGTTPGESQVLPLSVPPPTEGRVPLVVHVFDRTRLSVRVGEADPVLIEMATEIPASRVVGVFVKDGSLVVHDLVVESFL